MTDLAPTAQIWIVLGIALVVGVVAAYVIGIIASLIVRVASHRAKWRDRLTTSARAPFRVLVGLVSFWISLAVLLAASTVPESETAWRPGLDHTLRIAVIAAGAWLVVALVRFAIDSTLTRYPTDVADNRVARRITTQLTMIRRVAIAVIVIVALGAALLTFPGVQAVGASLLASAGVLSVVAGIAAQSTLANIFAGLQLAFTDALRVDDVVIVENEWGRIEEITLTYVVVHLWDDRRLVLPSTYFTTTPFQNWTRRSSELLGAVEIDLDWQISPAEMRLYLDEVLAVTPLWDGRTKVLQVTEATGGLVRVRILVTAVDAPTLFDLRCYVREEFVEWLNRKGPAGLPRNRVQLVDAAVFSSGSQEGTPRHSDARQRPVAPVPSTASDTAADAEKHTPSPQPEGLFSGSAEAEQRAATFTTPIDVVDRDQLERDNKRSEDNDQK